MIVAFIAVWLVHDYHFVYLPDKKDKTWVAIEPRQCLDSRVPIKGDVNNVDFPREATIPNWTIPGATRSVEPYKPDSPVYNVTIYDAKSYGIYSVVCESCACPRGDMLYLLLSNTQLEIFFDFGYEKARNGILLLRRACSL